MADAHNPAGAEGRLRIPRVRVIDGFRGYAILGIVALHLCGLAGVLARDDLLGPLGWALAGNAIDFFFIVSAFVLFLPICLRGGEMGSARKWLRARGTRLLPAYWFCLSVMLVMLAATALGQFASFPTAWQILGNASGMQMVIRMFDWSFPIGFGVNGPLWMLSIVFCFYLVLPLIARPYFRHPLIGLGIACAITLIWKLAVLELHGFFEAINVSQDDTLLVQLVATDQLPGWAFSFGLGLTGAWAYTRAARENTLHRASRFALPVGLAALAVYAVCAYIYGVEAHEVATPSGGNVVRRDPALALVSALARAGLMAAIILGPLWLQRPFDNRPTRWLADQSYGLYLIHIVVALYLGLIVLGLPTDGSAEAAAKWFGVVIPVSLAYAIVSRRVIEQPARRWLRRREKRDSPPLGQEPKVPVQA